MDKKQFLKNFHEAVKMPRCKLALEKGWLRFTLGGSDKDRYDPIAIVCVYLKQLYYPNELKKSAKLLKISARLCDEINRAAFRYPVYYDRNLRRQLFRAAGLWT